jgi:hypothetical protein
MKMKMQGAGAAILAMVLVGTLPAAAQAGDPGQDAAPAVAMGSARMVRGTVTAVAGDKVTLKTENGDVFQVALTPNTRVTKAREQAKIGDIHVGDMVGAGGEIDPANKTVHALFVSVVDAEQVKKMRESLGKTWISGKVTAIDDTKLTILRSDKVSQVIEVDEDTSFKRGGRGMQMMMQGDGGAGGGGWAGRNGGQRAAGSGIGSGPGSGNGTAPDNGGESITLADVKVGDLVAGEGSLKNGVFVPKTLGVSDPSQHHRRQGEGTSAGANPVASPAAAGPQ